jgi:hypothetical protein
MAAHDPHDGVRQRRGHTVFIILSYRPQDEQMETFQKRYAFINSSAGTCVDSGRMLE